MRMLLLSVTRFEQVVCASITEELLIPEIIIDAEVELKDLTPSFYNIIRQMEPFGPSNVKPLFIIRNVRDTGHSKIVKENHIKFSITRDNVIFSGIGFNMVSKFHFLEGQKPVDIVFTLEENEWNDQKSLQLRVIDIKAKS